MTREIDVRRDLERIVGEKNVLVGADIASRHDTYPPGAPMSALAIVRPATTAEVSAILRYCDGCGIAVIPQGGRTGLVSGGKTGVADIALSFERMTAIEAIDRHGSTMTVQAGVQLQRVQEAALASGMSYPVDLGARGSATIGGTISTNAGGNSVLRYGMTRDQILGLEVVLADGTILSSMNRMMKNNAGYDLKQMFIGSEGTLGIVTRAVLRLRPEARPRATAWVGLANFDDVLALLALAGRESSGALTCFEVMWPSFLDAVVRPGGHQLPLAGEHAFHVLIEVASRNSQDQFSHILEAGWEQKIIADATLATSEAQASALWAIRDDIETLVSGLRPLFLYDISLPQVAMVGYLDALQAALRERWPRAVLIVFGHVADGNLHVCIHTGDEAGHVAVDDMVYGLLRPLSGSISAEHGIGLDKRDYLDVTRTPDEVALMARLKKLLDPNGTLNPGKVLAGG